MNTKIRAELAALQEAFAQGESIAIVHYASGNFYLAKDRPVEVTSISVVDLGELGTQSFSLADFKGDDAEDRERLLLAAFYEWLGAHQDVRIVHWNMNNADYGFAAIAARYEWLFEAKPPASIPQARMIDLDAVIEELYGIAYAPHPKLFNLGALNKLASDIGSRVQKSLSEQQPVTSPRCSDRHLRRRAPSRSWRVCF